MENETENSKITDKPWLFKKGQSGNPGGRPKGKSLKEYTREMLASMTDDERQEYLKGLPKDIIWKMSEGNPQTDVTSGGEKIYPTPILGGITNEVQGNNSITKDTSIKETP